MENARQMTYVEVPAFQGPLDLLLHLIQQNKVDIYDIPVALIADQFISTVKKMDALDMDVTSEFLVLAAQLLYLKSRELLPKPQKSDEEIKSEEELKQDLIERIVTYRAFKDIASYLSTKAEFSGNRYFRDVNIDELVSMMKPHDPLNGINMEDLLLAFNSVLKRIDQGEDIHYVQSDEVSVELMSIDIMRRMIINPKGMKFTQLLRYNSRVEIVVAFLALLELLREGKIRAEQSLKTNEIFVVPTDKAWDYMNEVSV